MANRFTCRDRHGALVVCDEVNWVRHETKHPEIRGLVAWVVQTIEQPKHECQDAVFFDRRVFYRQFTFPRLGVRWQKVVVRYTRSSHPHGIVVSAYAAPRVKATEVILWTDPTI